MASTANNGVPNLRKTRSSSVARPGTASTVSSYMSARPFLDENSPMRKPIPLPSIDSVSSQSHFNVDATDVSTADMLLNGTSVYTLPIGGTLGSGSCGTPRSPSLRKRHIVASAASAYGGSEDAASITSSRRTLQAPEDDATQPTSSSSNDAQDATPKPDNLGSWTIETQGTAPAQFSTPPSGSVSPEMPTVSLPVHPHHRMQQEDTLLSSMSSSQLLVARHKTSSAAPPSKYESRHHALSASSNVDVVNNHASALRRDSNSNKTISKETGSMTSSKGIATPSIDATFADARHDKGAGGSSNAFRDKLKKSGGFFKRFGGGANASPSSGGKEGVKQNSNSLQAHQRKPVSRKASHSSFVSDGGQSTAGASLRKSPGAARGDDYSLWTREDDVPVPTVPKQYRDQTRSNSGNPQLKSRAIELDESQLHQSSSTSSSALQADQSNSTLTSSTPKATQYRMPHSASTDLHSTIQAWEKEMDAALEQTGNDLEEKTKIAPPKSNWTPSPQLPEYRILNRKGSFMDEGANDKADHDSDSDDAHGSRYTTVKSYLPPSMADRRTNTLTDAFGISTSSASKKDERTGSKEPESVSYDSHFLRPDPQARLPRTSEPNVRTQPTQLMANESSLRSASTGHRNSPSRTPMSAPTQIHMHEGDPSDVRAQRAREDNASSVTTHSFETAVDRQSFFIRHGQSTDGSRTGDENAALRSTIAAVSPPLSPVEATSTNQVGLSSPLLPTNDPESSIRLIPRSSSGSNSDRPASNSSKMPAVHVSEVGDKTSADVDDLEDRAKELAQKCWSEDVSFKKREKIAEWLGGHGMLNMQARKHYFANFDFGQCSVDAALRKLCDKLFLRAETQQVDRILASFSLRYFECNPKTLFKSADIVHAVTFSILLLNTDLHVAELSDRMTRPQFIRNTLDAINEQHKRPSEKPAKNGRDLGGVWDQQMELVLRDIYISVKNDRIRLPFNESGSGSTRSPGSTPRLAGSERVNAFKRGSIRGLQGLIGGNSSSSPTFGMSGSGGDFTAGANALPRSSVASDRQERSSLSSLGSPSRQLNAVPAMGFANTLFKSIIRETQDEEADAESIDSVTLDVSDEELALMGPPWAKEGMLTRKHYWEAPTKRAKDKNWSEVFTVIQKGQMSMFRFGSSTASDTIKQSSPALGGGNWLSNATCVGQFSLAHSLANVLPPPGYNRNRPHVFALTLSSGSVFFFQTSHEELAQEWTSTCNYWAARLSKEPLAAGISNMEYGWNRIQSPQSLDLGENGGSANDLNLMSTDTLSEELEFASSPTESLSYHDSVSYGSNVTKPSGDARSIRSGRSGRSSRMRSTISTTLFGNQWNNGSSVDRMTSSNGNQSGRSSPVTSIVSLSTPATSVGTLDRPLIVHEWRTPAPPSTTSTLGEEEQFEALLRHTQRIEEELTHHNSLRQPMANLFRTVAGTAGRARTIGKGVGGASTFSLSPSPAKPSTSSVLSLPSTSPSAVVAPGKSGTGASSATNMAMANKAMANWERKSAYLLAELTKFQLYIESLKSASVLRAQKRDQRQINRMIRRADQDCTHLETGLQQELS